MTKGKRASGGRGDELDERGQLLQELIEVDDDVGRQVAEEVRKKQEEKEQAEDMGTVALKRCNEKRR